MYRKTAVAAVSLISAIMLVPAHASAMHTDGGLAYTLCATIDATVRQIAPTPAGFGLTVYDARLGHDRAAVLTASSTLEDRQGNSLKASMVRAGDRLSLYVPGRYTNAQCTLTAAPRVAFAQDASRLGQ